MSYGLMWLIWIRSDDVAEREIGFLTVHHSYTQTHVYQVCSGAAAGYTWAKGSTAKYLKLIKYTARLCTAERKTQAVTLLLLYCASSKFLFHAQGDLISCAKWYVVCELTVEEKGQGLFRIYKICRFLTVNGCALTYYLFSREINVLARNNLQSIITNKSWIKYVEHSSGL